MRVRPLMLSAGCPTALLLAAVLFLDRPGAAPADPPLTGPALQRINNKLDELEQMVNYQWWGRAKKEYDALEPLTKNVTNKVILDRVSSARDALATQPSAGGGASDPESRRRADLLQRLRADNSSFPTDKVTTIRVKPDGTGDSRTIAEALAKGDDREVIELYTGRYVLNPADLTGKGRDGRKRSHVFFAARGEWPRIVPTSNADFTLEKGQWLDGVELVVGRNGLARDTVDLHNCYVRAAQPPTSVTAGQDGLVNGDPAVTDCVLENLLTALRPGRYATVTRNLFIACVTAVRRDGDTTLDRCAFYRCLAAAAGERFKANACVFSRCKAVAASQAAVDSKDCLEADDPFRDPFTGDFRLRADTKLAAPAEISRAAVGPEWSAERWEMFAANFDRPISDAPVSLADARDLDGAGALAEVRKAAGEKDYPAAARALAAVLEKYAACPSVRPASAEIEGIVNTVLGELVKQRWADYKNKQLAQDQLRQAASQRDAGSKDEALATAQAAVQIDPQSIDARLMIAELLLDTGRPSQAVAPLKVAQDLIESEPEVASSVRIWQAKLQLRVTEANKIGDAWRTLLKVQAKKYADLMENSKLSPGPPSYALAFRRAVLLAPDNKDYESRRKVGDSLLKPLTTDAPANPDPDKAKEKRLDAVKQWDDKKYDEAINLRRKAYGLDPSVDDLLFLAKCYQKEKTFADAAVMALQARQHASAIEDEAERKRVVKDATDILHAVDKPMIALEALDTDFISTVEARRKAAEDKGDKDTAEQMDKVLEKFKGAQLDTLVEAPKLK